MPRLPLARPDGGVVTQRTANPCTPVRFRLGPPPGGAFPPSVRKVAAIRRLATLAVLTLAACHPRPPSITVREAWVAPAGSSAAAYATIVNPGGKDQLLSVEAPGTGPATLHESRMDGGVMRMRALPNGLPVPDGGTVTLAPMGLHVMIMPLAHPLHAGEHVPLTFRFQRQGAVEVSAEVRAAAGMAH